MEINEDEFNDNDFEEEKTPIENLGNAFSPLNDIPEMEIPEDDKDDESLINHRQNEIEDNRLPLGVDADSISALYNDNVVVFDKMIEGMPNNNYHGFGGLSSTKFPLIDLSIRAFEHRHLFDFAKPVFDEGNLCHDCILLPHLVDDNYIESPTVGLDTLAANRLREDNPDKMIVGQGDIEKYQTIAKLVRVIVHFINFETTKKEVSFFHKHEETGLIFQIRPDVYNPQLGLLYDVKSTKANNHREFNKIIEEYNYDLSIAFYFDVLILCGYKVDIEYTGWICVPKMKPNIPFVFRCSNELLEKGRSKYQRLLGKYVDYKKSEKELGVDDNDLIYSDIADKVAHSWEYRKESYI